MYQVSSVVVRGSPPRVTARLVAWLLVGDIIADALLEFCVGTPALRPLEVSAYRFANFLDAPFESYPPPLELNSIALYLQASNT